MSSVNAVFVPFYDSVMFRLYMHHICSIRSSVDGHLGCFHILAIINSATVNNGLHVFFQIMVFCRYMPRSGIAGSYGSSIFFFFKDPYYYFP